MKDCELKRIIGYADVTVTNADVFMKIKQGTTDIERHLKFELNGHKYSIEWFKNIMYLHIGNGIKIMFTKVEYSGTWPNHFKMNLQFYYGHECVCVMGVKKYYEDAK